MATTHACRYGITVQCSFLGLSGIPPLYKTKWNQCIRNSQGGGRSECGVQGNDIVRAHAQAVGIKTNQLNHFFTISKEIELWKDFSDVISSQLMYSGNYGADGGTNAATSASTRQIQRRASRFRLSFRSKRTKQAMVDRNCSELAIEGERLCREGSCSEGIERLEAALKVGTSDLKTLSALYSQLGNAYFYLENYSKCLECHKLDLELTRKVGDKLGEAKASGNIGSALKAMGQFDESIACCRMQLALARDISNKVSERAELS